MTAGDVYTCGDIGGEETVSLTAEQNGPHAHGQNINGTGTDAWGNRYGPQVTLPIGDGSQRGYAVSVSGLAWNSTSANRVNTDTNGSGAPHNNMPPYRVVYAWERVA